MVEVAARREVLQADARECERRQEALQERIMTLAAATAQANEELAQRRSEQEAILARASSGEDVTAEQRAIRATVSELEAQLTDNGELTARLHVDLSTATAATSQAYTTAQRGEAEMVLEIARTWVDELNRVGAEYNRLWAGIDGLILRSVSLGGREPAWLSNAKMKIRESRDTLFPGSLGFRKIRLPAVED